MIQPSQGIIVLTDSTCCDHLITKRFAWFYFHALSSLSGELEFSHTLDLKNPWNDNKPVKISRDGQVSPYVHICKVIF